MKNQEIVEHLNSLNITQTSDWSEDIPEEIWKEQFEDTHYVVETGLNVDKRRWYELSTEVISRNGGLIGVRSVTDCFSETGSIEDMCHKLEFFEMVEASSVTYIKK